MALVGFTSWAWAQETEGQINPNSLIPIPRYEQLFKVRVWRNIDLREKQNKGYFARGNEITKLILDAVKSGELVDIYYKDSVNRKMPKDEFLSSLVAQQGQTFPDWNPTQDWYQGDRVTVNQLAAAVASVLGRTDLTPIYAPTRAGDVRHSQADLSAIRAALGYAPIVSLEPALRATLDWYAEELGRKPS